MAAGIHLTEQAMKMMFEFLQSVAGAATFKPDIRLTEIVVTHIDDNDQVVRLPANVAASKLYSEIMAAQEELEAATPDTDTPH